MSGLPVVSTIWDIIKGILGRADKEKERRAEIKKSLYPSINSDLKSSLFLYRERFLNGQVTAGSFFTYLRDIEHSETIQRINSFDSALYQKLKRILELFPDIKKLEDRKQKVRKEIETAWENYVNGLREKEILSLLERRVNPFLSEVSSGIYWVLCDNEIERAREIYNDVLKRFEANTGIPDFTMLFPESFFNDLVEIFNEHWKTILAEYSRIGSQLEETIEREILPYMKTELNY